MRGRMRKLRAIFWVVPVALCVALGLAPAPAGAGVSLGRDGDRVIVGIRSGAPDAVAADVDGVAEDNLLGRMWTVRVPKGRGAAAVARLRGNSRVAWAEVDGPVRLAVSPSDPCYDPPSSPLCLNVDQWGLARVGAPVAWDLTRGSRDVVVAVLDTGVDSSHPDFAGGKVIVGGNHSGASSSDDRHGHGTHVAGTIAAATDNGEGVAGLGWNTRVRAVKVLDDDGFGTYTTVVRGIEEAVATGARVINMSFAGDASRALEEAVKAARNAGVVVVAAAGNEGSTDKNYPAAIDGVIGVGATDRNDNLASFSDRGSWVSIAAPGVSIASTCSTAFGNRCGPNEQPSNTGYAVFSGTSMASPHVAAAAALLFAAEPGLTGDQVRARLAATATPIAGTGTNFAWGRLDVAAALRGMTPGYWMTAADGGVFNFGAAGFHGSAAAPSRNVVGMAASPTRRGYWLVERNGAVANHGDARHYGGMSHVRLNAPVLGMERTTSGGGYWLVGADGGLFSFGDARFHGSTGGIRLNQPVVGMAVAPSGGGYWMVARDGGIFAFGDAGFFGSMGGTPLNQPVVGMASTPSGRGYWLVASDGGMFAFGDARFYGSMGGTRLNRPIVGMRPTPTGRGYWLVASDGGIFAFGDATFLGSAGGVPLAAPIVGMAS